MDAEPLPSKRNKLKKVAPSKEWSKKVDEMTNRQVNAVYLRLKEQNKI